MLVKDLVERVEKVQEAFDRKMGRKSDVLFFFVDLVEELGELAEVIRAKEFYKKKPKEVLSSEIADIFYDLIGIAKCYGVDFEQAVLNRLDELNKKFELGLSKEKIVRDRIPEIIRNSGREPKIRVASTEEKIKLLENKLVEELEEFLESKKLEELADLLEVIEALAVELGSGFEELVRIKEEKKSNRGGFEKGFVLELSS